MKVAESMVIFAPIDQLGCFSASSTVAVARRSRVPGPERAAGRRQRDALDRLCAIGGADGLKSRRMLAVDRDQLGSRVALISLRKTSPAETRHSLLASATRRP